ncbi:MAG TPA: hypothetical protein VH817_01160, partial [Thermoleophilaceae bacterium]
LITRERGAAAAAAHAAGDTVRINAVPNAAALGVPINTISGTPGSAGVHLGAPFNTTYLAPDQTAPLQLVVLDRTNLALLTNQSFTGDVAGTQQLFNVVRSYPNALAILATPVGSQSRAIQGDSSVGQLNSAIADIGGAQALSRDLVTSNSCAFGGNPCTTWSVVGTLGAKGGGVENPGLHQAPNENANPHGPIGNVYGYLEQDSTEQYSFVNGDYVPFNTNAAGSTPTQAVMTVGSDTFTSEPNLQPGQGAFFVVILDAGTLQFISANTYVFTGPGSDVDVLQSMDESLEQYIGDPGALVFIQSVGAAAKTTADSHSTFLWNNLIADVIGFSGSVYAPFFFNTMGDYGTNPRWALVGPGTSPLSDAYSANPSPLSTFTPGQVSGVLGRNTQSQFYPKIAGSNPTIDYRLPQLAYSGTSPWPDRDTPGHNAAIACVAASLQPAVQMPIESGYTNANLNWDSSYFSTLTSWKTTADLPDTPICSSGFTASDFADVRSQLLEEWSDIGTVRKLISNLQTPLLAGASSMQVHLADVTQDVQSAVQAPDNATVASDAEQTLIDIGFVASNIPEVGTAFGVGSSIGQLMLEVSNTDDGTPALNPVSTAAASLPDTMATQYNTLYSEYQNFGRLLLTDFNKLDTAAGYAAGPWAWDQNENDTQQSEDALDVGMTKVAYEALFPAAFHAYDFPSQNVSDARNYVCFVPGPLGEFNPFLEQWKGGVVDWYGADVYDLVAFGLANPSFLSGNPNAPIEGSPPSSLMDAMFTNPPPNSTVTAPPIASAQRMQADVFTNGVYAVTNNNPPGCDVNGKSP